MDPIERRLTKPVEEMNGEELGNYIRLYLVSMYELELSEVTFKEKMIMDNFIKSYPTRAGKMVQRIMMTHKGKVEGGDYVGYSCFSPGWRWWLDKISLEVQEKENLEKKREKGTSSGGFLRLTDLGQR